MLIEQMQQHFRSDPSLLHLLNKAEVVKIQNVADYFYHDGKEQHDCSKMNVMPPFDIMWSEFKQVMNGDESRKNMLEAKKQYIKDVGEEQFNKSLALCDSVNGMVVKYGILSQTTYISSLQSEELEQIEKDWSLSIKDNNIFCLITLDIFITVNDTLPSIFRTIYPLTKEGELVNGGNILTGTVGFKCIQINSLFDPTGITRMTQREEKGLLSAIPYFLALNFSHVKAVKIKKIAPWSHAHNKMRLSKGLLPLVRYSEIQIPFVGAKYDSKTGTWNASTSLHIVRGHFMNATSEAPLFGQPWGVGKFWVVAHTVGKEENGVTLHTYNVKPQ